MFFSEMLDTGDRRTGRTTKTINLVADWIGKDGPRSVVFYTSALEIDRLAKLLHNELEQRGLAMKLLRSGCFEVERPGAMFAADVIFTAQSKPVLGIPRANQLQIADHFFVEGELKKIAEQIDWLREIKGGCRCDQK